MPLHVVRPASRVLATWRLPLLGRLLCTAICVVVLLAFVPWVLTDPSEQRNWGNWWLFMLVPVVAVLPWRLVVRLHEDVVIIRGFVPSQVVPLAKISLVAPTPGGLGIWWGGNHSTIISFFGARGFLSKFFDAESKGTRMQTRILAARDKYLADTGLTAVPDLIEEP